MRVLEQKRVTAMSVNVLVVIILMKQQKKGDYITELKIKKNWGGFGGRRQDFGLKYWARVT